MLEPTNRLMELSRIYKAPFTYFVDAGFLFQLKALGNEFRELKKQHHQISEQLKLLISEGNDVQLHIHPHWELAKYEKGLWEIPQDKGYRMDEFSRAEARDIFIKYKSHLDEVIGRKTLAYRAGGWCIQPFEHIMDFFAETEMHFDSSVVPGMVFQGGAYNIDFSEASKTLDFWCFEKDPTQINRNGRFVEIPISAYKYYPKFYWEMYIRGRMNKARHRFVGDGNFIPQPGRKFQSLTRAQWSHVSCDGFYAKKLLKIAKSYMERNRQHLVVIGHPKGMTAYSFDKLEQFLIKMHRRVEFQTFSKYHDQTR